MLTLALTTAAFLVAPISNPGASSRPPTTSEATFRTSAGPLVSVLPWLTQHDRARMSHLVLEVARPVAHSDRWRMDLVMGIEHFAGLLLADRISGFPAQGPPTAVMFGGAHLGWSSRWRYPGRGGRERFFELGLGVVAQGFSPLLLPTISTRLGFRLPLGDRLVELGIGLRLRGNTHPRYSGIWMVPAIELGIPWTRRVEYPREVPNCRLQPDPEGCFPIPAPSVPGY